MVPVTALQAILRSHIELAINGNYRAQCDILKAVQHIELLESLRADDETDDDETDEVGEGDEGGDAEEAGESNGDD